jgi:hypothetical protein
MRREIRGKGGPGMRREIRGKGGPGQRVEEEAVLTQAPE